MRKFFRYSLIVAVVAVSIALVALFYVAEKKHRRMIACTGLKITIADKYSFVTEEEIKEYIDSGYGTYIGQKVDSVNLVKIEKILDSRSVIRKSEAFVTRDGYLNVIITQREPVVRFNKKDGRGFYADSKGFLFPLQSNYTSLVPIVDGNIPINISKGYKGQPERPEESEWLSRIISVIDYMQKHKIWMENIAQIHIEDNGDLVMIMRMGKERFIFGPPYEIKAKFDRIEKYYKCIIPEKGENYYSYINVKYKNRIICRK